MNYTDEDIAELADLFTDGPETDADNHVAVEDVPPSRATTVLGSIKTERSDDIKNQAWVMSGSTASTAVHPSIQTGEKTDKNVFSSIWRQDCQPERIATGNREQSAACGSDHQQNLPVSTTSLAGSAQRQSAPVVNEHSVAHLRNLLKHRLKPYQHHAQQQGLKHIMRDVPRPSAAAVAENDQQTVQNPSWGYQQNIGPQQQPAVTQRRQQERQQTSPRDTLATVNEQRDRHSVSQKCTQYQTLPPQVGARHYLPLATLGDLNRPVPTSGLSQPATNIVNYAGMYGGNYTHQQQQSMHFKQQTLATHQSFPHKLVAPQRYTHQERHVSNDGQLQQRPMRSQIGQQEHILQARSINAHQHVSNQWRLPQGYAVSQTNSLQPRLGHNGCTPVSLQQLQNQHRQQEKEQQQHRFTTTYMDIHQQTNAQCNPPQRFMAPGLNELQLRHANTREAFSHRPANQMCQQQLTAPTAVQQPGTTQWGQGPVASHGDISQPRLHRSQPHISVADLVSEQQQQRLIASNADIKQHRVADSSQLSLPPNITVHIKQSKQQGIPTPLFLHECKPAMFALEDLRQHEPVYCGEAFMEEVTLTQAQANALFDPISVVEVQERNLPIPKQQTTSATSRCESPMDCSIPTLKDNADGLQVENRVLKNDIVHTGSFNKKINTYENPYDLTLKDLDNYQESYEKEDFLTSELCSMEYGRGESQSPDSVMAAQGDVPLMVKPNGSTAMDTSNNNEYQYINIKPVCSSSTMELESDQVAEPSTENRVPENLQNSGECPEPIVISPEPDHPRENQCPSIGKNILPSYKRGRTSLREERILEFWAQKLGYVLPTKKQVAEVAFCLKRKMQFVLIWLNKQSWAQKQYHKRQALCKSHKQNQPCPTPHQQSKLRTILPQANLIPTTVNTTENCNTARLQPGLTICDGKVILPNESDNLNTWVNTEQNPKPAQVQHELPRSSCESDSSSSVDMERGKTAYIKLRDLDSQVRSGSEIESDTSSGEGSVLKEQCQSDSNSDNPSNLVSELTQEFVRSEQNCEKTSAETEIRANIALLPKHAKKLLEKQKQAIAEKTLRIWMSVHPGNIRPNEEEVQELCRITDTSPLYIRRFFARMRMNSNKELWLQNLSLQSH